RCRRSFYPPPLRPAGCRCSCHSNGARLPRLSARAARARRAGLLAARLRCRACATDAFGAHENTRSLRKIRGTVEFASVNANGYSNEPFALADEVERVWPENTRTCIATPSAI